MATRTGVMALIAGAALSAASSATVYFTFDDPSNPREVTYVAGTGGGNGTVSYSAATNVDLVVDAEDHGFGTVTYSSLLTMELTVGAFNGFFAPVWGEFTFTYNGNDILTGAVTPDFDGGRLLAFGQVGVMTFTDTISAGAFEWTAANDLLAQLGGAELVSAFNGSFSLSNITPGVFGPNNDGYIPSFTANAAFVGDAQIPTPGAAALLALAGVAGIRRRR